MEEAEIHFGDRVPFDWTYLVDAVYGELKPTTHGMQLFLHPDGFSQASARAVGDWHARLSDAKA